MKATRSVRDKVEVPQIESELPLNELGIVPAKITIGTISEDSQSSKFREDSPGVWTDYRINNYYENDLHIYMLGVTSPDGFNGDTASFVQLTAPTLLWICDWTACRFGVEPVRPNPNLKDGNWILLDKKYIPVMIVVGPDGVTPLYRISGTFVYGHKKPSSQVTDNMNYPIAAWLEDSFERRVQSVNEANYIIDTSQTSQESVPTSPFTP